ncbi:MAG TPA: M20/M25/M40 family metallo-hydrolase [Anaerolineales bacterium]|jgi:acetylornithine deacetylase/succinyl-diaminopimelate desuccinylase-like protein
MVEFTDRLLELAVQIQQIPAPTFDEAARAAFVQGRFVAEGLADVSQDALGNVYARLAGAGSAPPLVVCAHLDTVFPAGTSLETRREGDKVFGPGLGDNSLGVAALFGLVWRLREAGRRLPGDIWLVGDVGEEGLGDLRGMKCVVDRFGAAVQAYLLCEGLALGHIYHRAVGVQRYRITARTAGGHSWSDYGRPSAVHELAALVTKLAELKLPAQPRTTLNVGTITGGTTVNTLASEAAIELDLRSESSESLNALIAEVHGLIAAAQRDGVTLDADITSQRAPGELPADHPLVRLALEVVRAQGVEAVLTAGSTDANVPLSRGLPAVVLGVTTGGGAHTKHEFIHTAFIEQGMQQLVGFASGAWEAG